MVIPSAEECRGEVFDVGVFHLALGGEDFGSGEAGKPNGLDYARWTRGRWFRRSIRHARMRFRARQTWDGYGRRKPLQVHGAARPGLGLEFPWIKLQPRG